VALRAVRRHGADVRPRKSPHRMRTSERTRSVGLRLPAACRFRVPPPRPSSVHFAVAIGSSGATSGRHDARGPAQAPRKPRKDLPPPATRRKSQPMIAMENRFSVVRRASKCRPASQDLWRRVAITKNHPSTLRPFAFRTGFVAGLALHSVLH
jgi:hypothetical protein